MTALLVVGAISACSSASDSTQPATQSSQSSDYSSTPIDSAPSKPALIDLDADDSWRAACVLPIATVAQETAPLGTDVKEIDYNQLGDPECEYDTAHTSTIPSLGVQLREYDSSSSYGTNDTGTGEWLAPDPATGYQQACAAYGGQCVTGIGDGVALGLGQDTAQVFLDGPYFYQLQLYELEGSDGSGQILLSLARDLVTAPAPKR